MRSNSVGSPIWFASLLDPTKLATLGPLGANPRVQKAVSWLAVARQQGQKPQVVLDIRSKEGAKRIDLRRDRPGAVKVAGIEYDLLYPSVSVGAAPGERPTTNKAMLMVTRRL